MPTCIHCGIRKGHHQRRGLCWKCFQLIDIRVKYPARFPRRVYHEPTMAEVEAIVAEQMQNLPPWWNDETQRVLCDDPTA